MRFANKQVGKNMALTCMCPGSQAQGEEYQMHVLMDLTIGNAWDILEIQVVNSSLSTRNFSSVTFRHTEGT